MLEGGEEGVHLDEGGAVGGLELVDGGDAESEAALKVHRWAEDFKGLQLPHIDSRHNSASTDQLELPGHVPTVV